MLKTVLIPTDFSENALHALRHSLNLFKCDRTNFYLLHAYADDVYGQAHSQPKEVLQKLKTETKKKVVEALKGLSDWARKEYANPKHTFEEIAVFEPLVDGINNFVNEINVDLLVMGTQGMTSDRNKAFGSHTVQVFKYVLCPVLAVPANCEYTQPKKILFPTDFMVPYKRRELKFLNEIAGSFKSKIILFYISKFSTLSHRQEDNKLFLLDAFSKAYLDYEQSEGSEKISIIHKSIEEMDIDMLVMVNSRHSFMEDMLYRSTVEQMGLTVNVPFLVLQNISR